MKLPQWILRQVLKLTYAVVVADPRVMDTPYLKWQSDEGEDGAVVGTVVDTRQPTTPRPTPDRQHLFPEANHGDFGNNINPLI